MDEDIKRELYRLNNMEKIQKETGQFIMDHPKKSFSEENGNMKLLNEYFFKNKDIYVSKHNRYADYPYHSHQFLELNYMLQGECQQIIEGKEEMLQEGELLLLDSGCRHLIKATGDHDILINILFRDQNINLEWLTGIKKKNSLVYDFLLNSTVAGNRMKKYIIFKSANIPHIRQILEQIITEYFRDEEFSTKIITLYLPILFTELVRKCDTYLSDEVKNLHSETNNVALNTLQLIEQDYRDITLSSAAEKLGYNKNYLSNVIKKKTGSTFTELVNKQKILAANLLIESTSMPINDIIEQVGFQNKTYFYSLYKKEHQMLPLQKRAGI
ncbi:helix-turn-helix domain-containing protein [Paenibacillus donghaensis]|jgi:AraC-like DNA-binding protein/mannose-6-phosphate isomerase-like protein (cupin superfamily)|uniref:AraC family transcriptional regulator n=1 Tax=Paenibacillus donghaensis TaxID=414771 RepID=UPI001883ED04|nr:helix-turn-helix domain-containing protein [Paenibacillus donghaensis]MBE9913854.1 helix-turn-helix domain-containing protein [Paenibacillus donghaensis]